LRGVLCPKLAHSTKLAAFRAGYLGILLANQPEFSLNAYGFGDRLHISSFMWQRYSWVPRCTYTVRFREHVAQACSTSEARIVDGVPFAEHASRLIHLDCNNPVRIRHVHAWYADRHTVSKYAAVERVVCDCMYINRKCGNMYMCSLCSYCRLTESYLAELVSMCRAKLGACQCRLYYPCA
jgi:hypothetical protein